MLIYLDRTWEYWSFTSFGERLDEDKRTFHCGGTVRIFLKDPK